MSLLSVARFDVPLTRCSNDAREGTKQATHRLARPTRPCRPIIIPRPSAQTRAETPASRLFTIREKPPFSSHFARKDVLVARKDDDDDAETHFGCRVATGVAFLGDGRR